MCSGFRDQAFEVTVVSPESSEKFLGVSGASVVVHSSVEISLLSAHNF